MKNSFCHHLDQTGCPLKNTSSNWRIRPACKQYFRCTHSILKRCKRRRICLIGISRFPWGVLTSVEIFPLYARSERFFQKHRSSRVFSIRYLGNIELKKIFSQKSHARSTRNLMISSDWPLIHEFGDFLTIVCTLNFLLHAIAYHCVRPSISNWLSTFCAKGPVSISLIIPTESYLLFQHLITSLANISWR